MAIDVITIIVLVFGFVIGYSRGIIAVLFNVISYTLGVVLAFKISPQTTSFLEKVFNSTNPLMFFAGFLLNLAIVMIVVRYAAKGIESLLAAAYLGTLNQVLGGAVYGGGFVLLFSVLLWFGEQTLIVNEETKRGSKTVEYLEQMPGGAKKVLVRIQPVFSEIWHTSMIWMDKMKAYTPDVKQSEPKIYDIEEDKQPQRPTSRGVEDFPEPTYRGPRPKDYSNGIEND